MLEEHINFFDNELMVKKLNYLLRWKNCSNCSQYDILWQGRWALNQGLARCQRQQPWCCCGGSQCLCGMGPEGRTDFLNQFQCNFKPMFSRSNRRKTQMESTSVWSRSSRFRTATLTPEAGVDLRLTVLLSVQWLSPSKISWCVFFWLSL